MRPLILHASALTDSEYSLYTTSLCDLAGEDHESRAHSHDDSYYAALKISVREARAWIRGRYTDLSPASVDAVLKLFCPNIGVTDVLNGGQFFAALRLVTHVRHGKPVDGSLVFVQAHPNDAQPNSAALASASTSENAIPTPTDSRRSSREVTSLDDPAPLTEAAPVRSQAPAPLRPTPAPAVPPKPVLSTQGTSSTNPFINRARSQDLQPSSSSRTRNGQSPLPPLPPRKPTAPPPPPPRHLSLASPNTTSFPTSAQSPAFAFWQNQSGSTPTNPNVLIQQSLHAGRIAQSLKKAEEKLEKERVLEVLKSSSTSGARARTRSESPTKETNPITMTSVTKPRSRSSASGSASSNSSGLEKGSATITSRGPALPPRRRPSPPPSATSARSFEQVAQASISLTSRSLSSFSRDGSRERRCSPPPQHPDLVPQPPPTHPDRKPLPPPSPSTVPDTDSDRGSSPGRAYRSKSVHYPQPPVPPPRRKRPESIQYGPPALGNRAPSPTLSDRTSKSANTALSSPATIPYRGSGGGTVSRHLSLSTRSSRRSDSGIGSGTPKDDSPMANIRNTLMGLQPKLDAARYKAEAGLSRRGFVHHRNASLFHEEGEERLVASETTSLNGDGFSRLSIDSDDGLGQDSGVDGSAEEKGAKRWDEMGGYENEWERRGRSASEGEELRKGKMKPWEVDRDDMKWPVGEGWKPL